MTTKDRNRVPRRNRYHPERTIADDGAETKGRRMLPVGHTIRLEIDDDGDLFIDDPDEASESEA